MTEIVRHAPGIYFGMPFEEYLADDALGSTDLKALLFNPVQWRFKKMQELRIALGLEDDDKTREADTVAQRFGHAVHTMVLEPEHFDDRYVASPTPPADLITTRDQLRMAIEEITGRACTLPKSAAHLDHVMEARRHGVTGLREDWEFDRIELVNGREELSRRWMSTLNLINKMMDMPRADYENKSLREVVLTNGMSEVSIFWVDETGVRLKARFDYLRVKAVVDVKTYAARDDQEIIEAFWSAVARWGHDMQAEHYQDARAQIPGLVERGLVSGDHDPVWLKKVADYTKRPTWVWLAVQTVGMPEVDELRFPAEMISAAAAYQVQMAKENFRQYRDRFGLEQPWVSTRGPILMTDETCPSAMRIQSRGSQRWTTM